LIRREKMIRKNQIITMLCLFALCSSAPAVNAPIAHWTFDEGSGTIAYDSAGSNNGTVTGATWTTGRIDGALSFDGSSDFVMVGDKDNLEQQEFTLSFWAKLNNPSGNWQGGIAKGYIFGAVNEYSYTLDFRNGNARAAITNTSSTAFETNVLIGDTDWHMWSMTAEDGILKLYKDGVPEGSEEYTGTIDYDKSHNNFVIGARDSGNYAFNGLIDDVRFYDTALSQSDIQAIMPEPATVLLLGLGGLSLLRKRRTQVKLVVVEQRAVSILLPALFVLNRFTIPYRTVNSTEAALNGKPQSDQR
jgi:hypothetical protein